MTRKLAMISQPMNGLTDEEIGKVKTNAEELLTKMGYEVIDTFFKNDLDDPDFARGHAGVYFLGKSLEKMAICDLVFFCKGWENARGCRIEHDVAMEYNIDIIEE